MTGEARVTDSARLPMHRASTRAIVTMLIGAALLAGSDAASKYLVERYPLGQVLCLRHAATLLVIVPYAFAVTGLSSLRVSNVVGQLVRAGLFVLSAALMVSSLSLLPLATVTAIVFASPVFVALLSRRMLNEPVDARRWFAIVLGFAGVLVIVRPGAAAFELALLLPVGCALANGLRDVVTRLLSRTETSMSILFWSTIGVMLAGLATAPFGWRTVNGVDGLWFLAAGVLNAAAHFMLIEALRMGEAALVAPFRYTILIWATGLGFFIWGELPDVYVLAGALIIVASGWTMLRSQRLERAAADAPGAGSIPRR